MPTILKECEKLLWYEIKSLKKKKGKRSFPWMKWLKTWQCGLFYIKVFISRNIDEMNYIGCLLFSNFWHVLFNSKFLLLIRIKKFKKSLNMFHLRWKWCMIATYDVKSYKWNYACSQFWEEVNWVYPLYINF